MANINVINQVLVLFIIVSIGYYCGKKAIITEEINQGLSDVLIKVACPLLVINSFNFHISHKILSNIIMIIILSFIVYIFFILISKILFITFNGNKKNIAEFFSIFSNCGFMGFPVLYAIYKDVGVLYASVFNISFNIFIWTYGIMIFKGKKSFKGIKSIIKNPGIASVIIGIIVMLLPVKLPYAIMHSIELVGSMTTPLSMIVIGFMLTKIDIKMIFSNLSLYYICFIRLVFAPVATWAILSIFHADQLVKNVIIMCEAMPAASLGAIFAQSSGKEPEYASQVIFITTLLSVISIPLVIMCIL
ncbi:AEC family transporter [Clostridium oryzae]|uniref:Membrane transport protein n=1 Tax=Clostridium oryzae TaxID=1450648 RepID=A0A1V4IH68_9CLOT|nr:AEC family transporter [Clostridium oryzae]OPJ59342.1 membrane transport protein [Clostridium oryzae]